MRAALCLCVELSGALGWLELQHVLNVIMETVTELKGNLREAAELNHC